MTEKKNTLVSPTEFEDWFAELHKLAAPFIERGEIRADYLDLKSWRDYFEDGYTPAGASADDKGAECLEAVQGRRSVDGNSGAPSLRR